jgi:hypothetical protein
LDTTKIKSISNFSKKIAPSDNMLIRQNGADAGLEAARLQDLMLDRGVDEGRLVWGRQASNRGVSGSAARPAALRHSRSSGLEIPEWRTEFFYRATIWMRGSDNHAEKDVAAAV